MLNVIKLVWRILLRLIDDEYHIWRIYINGIFFAVFVWIQLYDKFKTVSSVSFEHPTGLPFIIPPLHRRWKGGILDSPWCLSVRLSVRPSVGKVSATFRENYWLNSFHTWDLYLWGKSLDPYRFACSCPHFWPSGGQKLTENRGFRNFSRKLSARFISSLGFILMG